MTIWDRPGNPLKPETDALLFQTWGSVHGAELMLGERRFSDAVRRAYRIMVRTAEALVYEEHGDRFHTVASYPAAFWDQFVRTGRADAQWHEWLLKAYYASGRDGQDPMPAIDAAAAREMVERARAFLAEAHRLLGLRSPFPPAKDPPVAPSEGAIGTVQRRGAWPFTRGVH